MPKFPKPKYPGAEDTPTPGSLSGEVKPASQLAGVPKEELRPVDSQLKEWKAPKPVPPPKMREPTSEAIASRQRSEAMQPNYERAQADRARWRQETAEAKARGEPEEEINIDDFIREEPTPQGPSTRPDHPIDAARKQKKRIKDRIRRSKRRAAMKAAKKAAQKPPAETQQSPAAEPATPETAQSLTPEATPAPAEPGQEASVAAATESGPATEPLLEPSKATEPAVTAPEAEPAAPSVAEPSALSKPTEHEMKPAQEAVEAKQAGEPVGPEPVGPPAPPEAVGPEPPATELSAERLRVAEAEPHSTEINPEAAIGLEEGVAKSTGALARFGASKLGKGLKIGGHVAGAGLMAYGAYQEYKEGIENKESKGEAAAGAVGATLGGLTGGVGAMAGQAANIGIQAVGSHLIEKAKNEYPNDPAKVQKIKDRVEIANGTAQTLVDSMPSSTMTQLAKGAARSGWGLLQGDTKAAAKVGKEWESGKAGAPLMGITMGTDLATSIIVQGEDPTHALNRVTKMGEDTPVAKAGEYLGDQTYQFVNKDLPEAAEFAKKDLADLRDSAKDKLDKAWNWIKS
jgi:hypothetical protein